jgi:NitT/TauT family transport system substrate-binding protein
MAYGWTNAEIAPLWLALDQGIFQNHRLDVEATLMQTSAQVTAAMVAGEIDTALNSGSGVVDVNLAGGDQVILATQTNILAFTAHARSDIQRVEDLRDQRFAITRLGSTLHRAADVMFSRVGMDAGRDVTLVQAGTTSAVLSTLVAGAADGAMLAPPFNFLATRQGFPLLVDLSEYRTPYSNTSIVTTRQILDARYEPLRDFVAAYAEAVGIAKREPLLTKRVLAKHTQSADEELLDSEYRAWVAGLDERLFPSAPAVQAVLDHRAANMPAARTAPPADFIDDRIMRELQASGYLQRVLGTAAQ